MSDSYTAKEGGYAYLYVSNEHPTQVDVYFDDISMSYTPSRIIQSNEYYPFGAQTARSWTRESAAPNNFLGNGGTEYNATSSQYDLDYRNYDPILGRLNQVDPLSHNYGGMSPYHFSFNNPVTWSDPSGASADKPSSWAGGPYEAGTPWSHNWFTGRPANYEGGHLEANERMFWQGVTEWRDARFGGRMQEYGFKYGITVYNGEEKESKNGKDTQDLKKDVTDKFYSQLARTELYFTIMKEIFDNTEFTVPGNREIAKLEFFASLVGNNKFFDIKAKGKEFSKGEIGEQAIFEGDTYNYDDFGNINFGYAAKIFGIPLEVAKMGAGANQIMKMDFDLGNSKGYFDHPRDTQMIEFGYAYNPPWPVILGPK